MIKIILSTILLAAVGELAIIEFSEYFLNPVLGYTIGMIMTMVWGCSCRSITEKLLGVSLQTEYEKRRNEKGR